MSVRKNFLLAFSFLLLGNIAFAQNQMDTISQTPNSHAVTASVSAAGVIRVTSPQAVLNIRLEVYAPGGDVVYDSGLRQGSVIDWKVGDAASPLADGSYLFVITIRDLQARYRQKLGSLSVQAGQLTLKGEQHDRPTAAQTDALSSRRLSQKIEAADANEAITVLRAGKERSLVISAHDGTDGQVTSTSGALTLRTGDLLTGKDKEQVRITPNGNVGIGTDKPQATLDVAGPIRARGGIQFEDGTVLKSAANLGTSTNVTTTSATGGNAIGSVAAPLAGTGKP